MTDLPPSENSTSNPLDNADLPPEIDRHRLTSDELIALFLALVGIGSIFFWIIQQKQSPIYFSALTSGSPFANGTTPRSGTTNSSEATANSANQPANQIAAAPSNAISAENANGTIGSVAPSAQPAPSEVSSGMLTTQKPTTGLPNGATPSPIASPAPQAVSQPTAPSLENPGKPKAFTDVPESFWARQPILALSSRGILDGFKDGSFQPNKPITRAEFAGILGKAFEKAKTKPAIQFQDVKSDYWAATAIDESIQTGFMTGYPQQQFQPDQRIPRVQMLVAIVTGLGLTNSGDPIQVLSKYSDVQAVPKWAIPKVAAAEAAGLLGTSQNTLTPNQPATRADAATYIYQALVKEGKIKP
ncbi:S-layer homology domain-containing protein [Alkalinema pantanalense CENA528]|uniref:S-layer homology domain-containing protein n=1 Tax=Alkalinema pantanalense TaxID=1620705 RepID=UPI003D6DD6D4